MYGVNYMQPCTFFAITAFLCLPLLAIARIAGYLLCASTSKALWEQEAAANELNCFVLSDKISYNVPTDLFQEIQHG